MSRTADRTLRTRTVLTGAAAGFGAFLLGYLVTYVWQASRVEDLLSGFNVVAQLFGGEPIPTWKGVAWLFYNAHFVATRLPGLGGPRTVNFIVQSDDGSLALLYAVPPVVLFLGGLLTAALARATDGRHGALAGVATVPGYLVSAIVVASLSAYAVGDASVGPVLVTATLLAGAVYPLVFGTLGGVAGSVLTSPDDSD